MQMSQLRPAYAIAQQYGVKSLAYGGPGSGKTPLIKTAPRPVVCACEPGMLSLRDWDGPVWEAFTPAAIDEFFAWVFGSNEVHNFDTICIDSVSQMAETYLGKALVTHKHGLKAYGEMSDKVMRHLGMSDNGQGQPCGLYYLQQKHVYLVAKQMLSQEGGGITKKRPYFPGNELNVKVPHLYDEILHIGVMQIPGVAGQQRAIRTLETLEVTARDRSGRLAECEPCDLGALFAKCMS